MIPPSTILQAKLVDLSIFTDPTLRLSWPLFMIAEPDTPNQCATIYDTTPVVDGIVKQTGEMMQHYGLQLRVRDPSYASGWNKATEVKTLLPTLRYVTITVDGEDYQLQAAIPTSGVIPLGMDDKRRELFTVNFVATVKEI